jgi:hypothetical protein
MCKLCIALFLFVIRSEDLPSKFVLHRNAPRARHRPRQYRGGDRRRRVRQRVRQVQPPQQPPPPVEEDPHVDDVRGIDDNGGVNYNRGINGGIDDNGGVGNDEGGRQELPDFTNEIRTVTAETAARDERLTEELIQMQRSEQWRRRDAASIAITHRERQEGQGANPTDGPVAFNQFLRDNSS